MDHKTKNRLDLAAQFEEKQLSARTMKSNGNLYLRFDSFMLSKVAGLFRQCPIDPETEDCVEIHNVQHYSVVYKGDNFRPQRGAEKRTLTQLIWANFVGPIRRTDERLEFVFRSCKNKKCYNTRHLILKCKGQKKNFLKKISNNGESKEETKTNLVQVIKREPVTLSTFTVSFN